MTNLLQIRDKIRQKAWNTIGEQIADNVRQSRRTLMPPFHRVIAMISMGVKEPKKEER